MKPNIRWYKPGRQHNQKARLTLNQNYIYINRAALEFFPEKRYSIGFELSNSETYILFKANPVGFAVTQHKDGYAKISCRDMMREVHMAGSR